MNEKKIKVYAQVGDDLLFDVYVTVPQEAWDKELDALEEAVRDDIANCDDDEDFEQDLADGPYFGGYIGSNDGCSHGYTSAQGRIAYHLVSCQFGSILARLGVLEQLRDAIVKDLVVGDTEHQHEEELQMLESINNFVQAMLGEDEDDYDCYEGSGSDNDEEQIVTIWDRYPLELLDELAERVYGVPQTKTIVYLHGYGSSSQSNTVKYLAHNMPGYNVIAPDIPVDPKEALPFLKDYCRTHHADLVIGTSMGGMYAMQMTGYDRICVNPALHMSQLSEIMKVGTWSVSSRQPMVRLTSRLPKRSSSTTSRWSRTYLLPRPAKAGMTAGDSLPTETHWLTARTSLLSILPVSLISTVSTA